MPKVARHFLACNSHGSGCPGLWTITANELRHSEAHLLLLGRKNAMEQVGSVLIEMDRRLPVATMIALPMTGRDISDYLGLTIETVSRALSHLHRKG